MSFLLDTNVVSEWTKERPDPGTARWLAEADEDRIFLSVATVVELRYGIERLPMGIRRRRLDAWLDGELRERFEGRVLPLDEAVADACGRLLAEVQARGRSMAAMDAVIAATCRVHGLALITRNVRDFDGVVGSLHNPWAAG